MRTHCWRTCVAALLALVISSCGVPERIFGPEDYTSVEGITEAAKNAGADAAVEVLSDGEASLEDYVVIVDRARECLSDAGFWPGELSVNVVEGWRRDFFINYDRVNPHDVNKREQECTQSVEFVEMAYAITHEAVMAADLMVATRACLEDADHEVTGDERNALDLRADAPAQSARAVAIEVCVTRSAEELYPDEDARVIW